jgi:hypothetical protein
MKLDLTDAQTAPLLTELDRIIDGDRYPFSPRIRSLKEIHALIKPYPVHEPAPPPKHYEPPSKADTGVAVEGLRRPAGDTWQHRSGAYAADRVVQGLPPPGRARSGRDGGALRRRDDRAGVEQAAALLRVRQPKRQHDSPIRWASSETKRPYCRHAGEFSPLSLSE